MQANLIDLGDFKGVPLPQSVVEQAGLTDTLDLEVRGDTIVIRSAKRTRRQWAEAAAACHAAGEDQFPDWDAVTADFEGPWS